MKVFKFGGASVASAEKIRNVGSILSGYSGEKLLLVISALGKTTNALEQVTEAFFRMDTEKALELFHEIKKSHLGICKELGLASLAAGSRLEAFFTEVEWMLHDRPVQEYDYYYDQIVCVGELLSSSIVASFLESRELKVKWMDVLDIIRTDNHFRDASIDWQATAERVRQRIRPLFDSLDIVLTQGFIGSTDENESTTLGREGSDYSAAVFANLLDAESQTIWKDVPGVMNADPKQVADARWIRELNYREVIEMAYYGAQVIHPKTIKPLQNKNIPLYVRSFLDPSSDGTCIHKNSTGKLPPIIVYKDNQVLVQLNSKDFSFVGEGLTAEIYRLFEELRFRPNLSQNAAISFLCVMDEHESRVREFVHGAEKYFDAFVTPGLCLLTIRHYDDGIIGQLSANREILLKQQTPETIQMLMKK